MSAKSVGTVFKILVVFGFLLLLASAILYSGIDRQPIINRAAEITPANIERVKQILRDNDPRRLQPGEEQTIVLSEGDVDLALNYLVHRYTNGSARLVLNGDDAQVTASMRVADVPLGLYVNVDAVLIEALPLPRFARARIGRVPIPASLADWLLMKAVMQHVDKENFDALKNAVRQVDIGDGRLAVRYEWQAHLKENIRSAFLPAGDRERMRIYQQHLSQVTRVLPEQDIPLPQLLSPMFNLAEQRSRDGDPLAENRAAILILAFYTMQRELDAAVPEARDWPRAVNRTITLNGRDDFAKHFIVSAILAAKAGGPLADAVGVYKELSDLRGGSGFSFNDIAAARGGTRFGEKAVESAASARRLQGQVAAGVTDSDILPETRDLPEFMPDAEFKRRYGGVNAPLYQSMMAEIERRVAALSIYR